MGADGEDPHRPRLRRDTEEALLDLWSASRTPPSATASSPSRRGRCAAAPARARGCGARAARAALAPARETPPPTITVDGLRTTIADAMPRASRSSISSSTSVAAGSPCAAPAKTVSASIASGSPPASSSSALVAEGAAAARRRATRANALAPAACSNGPEAVARLVVVGERQVADLAGRAVRSAVDLAAEEHAAADADPDLDEERVVDPLRSSSPALGEERETHLVVDENRAGERAAPAARRAGSPPSPPSCGASVTRPETGSTTPGVPTPTAVRLGPQDPGRARARARPRPRRARAAHPRLGARAAPVRRRSTATTSPCEIGDERKHLVRADVDPEHVADPARKRSRRARRPGRRGWLGPPRPGPRVR